MSDVNSFPFDGIDTLYYVPTVDKFVITDKGNEALIATKAVPIPIIDFKAFQLIKRVKASFKLKYQPKIRLEMLFTIDTLIATAEPSWPDILMPANNLQEAVEHLRRAHTIFGEREVVGVNYRMHMQRNWIGDPHAYFTYGTAIYTEKEHPNLIREKLFAGIIRRSKDSDGFYWVWKSLELKKEENNVLS